MSLIKSLWKKSIGIQNVISVLNKIEISPNQIKSEKTVEKIIANELMAEFGANHVHPQYSIPGYFGMKVDLDIGDGKIGVELKLASSLDNSIANVQRLFGQAIYYYERQYEERLIVAVIGNSQLEEKPFMQEIEKLLNDINVKFVYITTKKRS